MDLITRAYDAKLDVSAGERSVVAIVNTAAVDRYRTVIDPAGIDLSQYRKNPVVLWEHGRGNSGRPIGRNAWIKYDKATKSLIAKTLFFTDEFADGIFQLYQSKGLNAFSVNILPAPDCCSSPTAKEIRDRPELADCYTVYRKSELAEYSAVAVPGNAEALALACSRGLWVPDALPSMAITDTPPVANRELPIPLPPLDGARAFGLVYAERIGESRAAHAQRVSRAIRDAIDLMAGRV